MAIFVIQAVSFNQHTTGDTASSSYCPPHCAALVPYCPLTVLLKAAARYMTSFLSVAALPPSSATARYSATRPIGSSAMGSEAILSSAIRKVMRLRERSLRLRGGGTQRGDVLTDVGDGGVELALDG